MSEMSEVAERDFRTFELGDNVLELAGAIVPGIAELLGMKLGDEPNGQELCELVGALRTNRVLRDGEPVVAIDRATASALVDRSGIQRQLSRSLWTPDMWAMAENIDVIIMTGAEADLQDRTAERLTWGNDPAIYVVAGNRVMDTAPEQGNDRIKRIVEASGCYPTESDYADKIIVPRLKEADRPVIRRSYATDSSEEIAERLFRYNPGLLDKRLAFATVANAGVQLAVQMRTAARAISPEFDADPSDPQVFIMTDRFPLAYIDPQEVDPSRFQHTQDALCQLVLTAKMLHEAATV